MSIPRLEKFLDKLGTAKGNGLSELFAWDDLNSSHWAVRDFQLLCFKNQDTLASRLQKMAEKRVYLRNCRRSKTGITTDSAGVSFCILAVGE